MVLPKDRTPGFGRLGLPEPVFRQGFASEQAFRRPQNGMLQATFSTQPDCQTLASVGGSQRKPLPGHIATTHSRASRV